MNKRINMNKSTTFIERVYEYTNHDVKNFNSQCIQTQTFLPFLTTFTIR